MRRDAEMALADDAGREREQFEGALVDAAMRGVSPRRATVAPTWVGSKGSSAPGFPVATLQKVQARVQSAPMIIMVACFLDQHSPMLGQAASSHTVCRLFSRMILRVSW